MAAFFRAVFAAGSVGGWVVAAGEALAAAEASAVAAAFLRDFFFAGDGDASAVPGEALASEEVSAVSFFRDFLAGEAEASTAGDPLATGDVSAAAAFLRECFDGDAEGVAVGDWPLTKQAPTNPITSRRVNLFVFMTPRLRKLD